MPPEATQSKILIHPNLHIHISEENNAKKKMPFFLRQNERYQRIRHFGGLPIVKSEQLSNLTLWLKGSLLWRFAGRNGLKNV